ncbi:MAG: hypothetical protein EOP53_03270 [Sphingobacteriales bacterium]|nr:MAG: hypothetical protein EOP53_03270 [Sphingobacteriales bacterium]
MKPENIYSFARLKLCLLLFSLLFFVNPLQAQKQLEDVVYLKNGSILHGTIIENIPGVSIKLQMADRSTWVFKMDEVEKMTREEKPGKPQRLSKEKGFYNVTSAGLIFDEIAGTLSMVNGYKWSPYVATGVLICLDAYGPNTYLPLGIDIRGEILRSTVTPYWYFQAGYPVVSPPSNTWETFKPGMMYQPGAGVQFMIAEKVGFLTEFGYKVQHLQYETNSWGITKQKIQMRNLTFKVGLQF